ncbi:hypothetical protein KIH87_02865 [Paraneptunicella aestuarii]|uniref:ribonuclease E inhibitor RraB n=1 Tax=Paraneptunicella aestuarii TaxID=2831148 RepID=UPI001E2B88F5|nr:ribonuclease E inhibitor RraB [Paraneptunicella aestuarii]UAA39322.1 hypothetical protein KIH87_02865 [Paraneptunicella aestuarii]
MNTNYLLSFDSGEQFLEQVTSLLVEKRLDKFKPVSFSFYLEFTDRQDAQDVSVMLTDTGFSVVMEQENESDKWTCWCNKSVTPTPLKLEDMAKGILYAIRSRKGDIKRWETNPYNSGQELGQLLAAFEHQYFELQADAA